MKKNKVMCVLGTRPEAIKLAPVIHRLQQDDGLEVKICSTGQHREMLRQMLKLFSLAPDIDLDLMQAGQDLSELSAKILLGLRKVFQENRPDLVIVQGDTTTAFMAALAAFYFQIPCAHVEAGLRTGDLSSPFPEEANRILAGHLSRFHFAPTKTSRDNLLKENISAAQIYVTGNTVIDALLWIKEKLSWQSEWDEKFASALTIIKDTNPIILVTGHRRESFGQGFEQICQALAEIATRYSAWHIVYPVHLNPQVRKPVHEYLSNLSNVHLIEPLDYAPFVYLMNRAQLILTDSGGVQEEAPTLAKPVLVMRDKTERPEAINAGTSLLVGTQKRRIVDAVSTLIDDPIAYQRMANAVNPYGDGQAAERIYQILKQYFVNKGVA